MLAGRKKLGPRKNKQTIRRNAETIKLFLKLAKIQWSEAPEEHLYTSGR